MSNTGWEEAVIAWSICRSIHDQYARKKDPFFKTRQKDFKKHEANARKMMAEKKKTIRKPFR